MKGKSGGKGEIENAFLEQRNMYHKNDSMN
jgi:hypothetical protein